MTPIDCKQVSGFIGVDVSRGFIETGDLPLWIRDKGYAIRYPTLCFVERGDRPSSLDRVLYEACVEAGVTFCFGNPLNSPGDLPPGSIIACGLHPEPYRALGIPHQRVYGCFVSEEMDAAALDRNVYLYYDDYTRDYFYGGCVNKLWYGLLFGREPIRERDRLACMDQLEEREGLRWKEWQHITGCCPTASIANPRLFVGKYIMAGSMSGMMDPFFFFGIHGALLSGKIAAMAVDRPEEALVLFRNLNRHFWKSYLLRKGFEAFPWPFFLYRRMMSNQRLFFPVMQLLGRGVPGSPDGWFAEASRTVKPL